MMTKIKKLLIQAKQYEESYAYKNAIAIYDKIIENEPTLARAYALRGFCWYQLKMYIKAEYDFSTAIELKEKVPTTFYFRALAREMQGNATDKKCKLRQSLCDYEKSAKLQGNQYDVFINKGLIYEYLKEFNSALREYKRALRINPGNEMALKSIKKITALQDKTKTMRKIR
jgi:tetratricopeptide (TPR) repeat protein